MISEVNNDKILACYIAPICLLPIRANGHLSIIIGAYLGASPPLGHCTEHSKHVIKKYKYQPSNISLMIVRSLVHPSIESNVYTYQCGC